MNFLIKPSGDPEAQVFLRAYIIRTTFAHSVDADNCRVLTETVFQIEGKRLMWPKCCFHVEQIVFDRPTKMLFHVKQNRFERECYSNGRSFERSLIIRMAQPFLARKTKKAAYLAALLKQNYSSLQFRLPLAVRYQTSFSSSGFSLGSAGGAAGVGGTTVCDCD